MKETLRFGLILLLFCAVSAGLLAVINSITAPKIALAELEATKKSYKDIFGEDADSIEKFDQEQIDKIKEKYPAIEDIFVAKKNNEIIGYGFNVKSNGFGGSMTNAIAISSLEDQIAGFRNISNQETKNYGSVIEEETYYSLFPGKTANGELVLSKEPKAENEIPWVSGATYSSKAVLAGANFAVGAYNDFLKESK
jgi:electron transport complex protein RnfG